MGRLKAAESVRNKVSEENGDSKDEGKRGLRLSSKSEWIRSIMVPLRELDQPGRFFFLINDSCFSYTLHIK